MSRYQRVVLKLSGEALKGDSEIFGHDALNFLADEIGGVYQTTQLAIVIGGGNIIRGRTLVENLQITQVTADHIGMAGTILNALLLENLLQKEGIETRTLTALPCDTVAEPYSFKKALGHLEKGRIIILAGGTGNAGVTTDTAAVLKALDLGADIVLKGTKVDGVFDCDPLQNHGAQMFRELTHQDFLQMGLDGILDETAVAQAKMKKIPILVFNVFQQGNLKRVLRGEDIGTLIS